MKVKIKWNFRGLNEFIDANRIRRRGWCKGNVMKQEDQRLIEHQLPAWHTEKPLWLVYKYYCPNCKKDLDNISGYFHKVFQDALVSKRIISNDSWKNIRGFSDEFMLDRGNPRVEIELMELQ